MIVNAFKGCIPKLVLSRLLILGSSDDCDASYDVNLNCCTILLLTGILDLVLNFPGYHRWKFTNVLRNILKTLVSAAWAAILPLCYLNTAEKVNLPVKDLAKWLGQVKGVPPLYIMAVAVYLLPNLLAGILFIFPMLRRWIENSDWHIIRFLLWWSQVQNAYFCSKRIQNAYRSLLFFCPLCSYISLIYD